MPGKATTPPRIDGGSRVNNCRVTLRLLALLNQATDHIARKGLTGNDFCDPSISFAKDANGVVNRAALCGPTLQRYNAGHVA